MSYSPPSDDAPIWHRLLNAATEQDAKSAVRAMVKKGEVDPPTADPYIPPAEGCSAGCHCKHPGGQENIDGCTHPCSNCGGIFHSVLFCGAHFSDVESKHCTISPWLLSPRGIFKYYWTMSSSRKEMSFCSRCIERFIERGMVAVGKGGEGGEGDGADSQGSSAANDRTNEQGGGDDDTDTQSLGLDVKSFLEGKVRENHEVDLLPYLIAISQGMSGEERRDARIQSFLSSGLLTKTRCKPSKAIYLAVTQFRIKVIKAEEEDFPREDRTFSREPKPKNWNIGGEKGFEVFLRTHKIGDQADKAYVMEQLDDLLDTVEQAAKEKKEQRELSGRHLNASTRRDLRMIMAIMEDEVRDALLNVYKASDRAGIDNRRSAEAALLTFYRLVADKCNDQSWVPSTPVFADAHTEFKKSTLLNWEADIDEEYVRVSFRDFRSRFNKSFANWKASGNGKGNYNERGVGVKILRFNNVRYEEDLEEYGEEDEKDIEFVDDDRFQFCDSRIANLFFWCMCDLHGLVTFVQQNCKKAGISSNSGGIPSARNMPVALVLASVGKEKMPRSQQLWRTCVC